MKIDVEMFDRFIVRCGRHYLSYVKPSERNFLMMLTPYKYDAAPIFKKSDAVRIARKVCGTVVKFNSLTGDIQG